MKWYQRMELWILLALVLGGLAWVFMSRSSSDLESDLVSQSAPAEQRDAALKIYRCTLVRDYGNARLDIDLRVRNDSSEKLTMQTPKVKLMSGKGREVPSFFLPFEQLPEVPAHATQDVQLRYWLEAADLSGSLMLEVTGQSVDVKSANPFDLEKIKNSESKTFNPAQW